MLFPTVTFAIFFMIVLPTSWLLMPRPRRWKPFMVAASYFFYGYWNWRFVFLIAVSTVGNQLFATAIHRHRVETFRRMLLAGAVVMNLGFLGYFKYYGFFVSDLRNILDRIGIGISSTVM